MWRYINLAVILLWMISAWFSNPAQIADPVARAMGFGPYVFVFSVLGLTGDAIFGRPNGLHLSEWTFGRRFQGVLLVMLAALAGLGSVIAPATLNFLGGSSTQTMAFHGIMPGIYLTFMAMRGQ